MLVNKEKQGAGMFWKTQIAIALLISLPLFSWAGPKAFNYQGRIFKTDGTPITSSSVDFKIQIRSAGAGCLLYEETHNLNMTGSSGFFSFQIGTGTRTTNDPGFTMDQVISNDAELSNAKLDDSGLCPGAKYTPGAQDARKIRVSFNDGVENVTITPDQTLNSAPYSMKANLANTLQGYSANAFILKPSSPTPGQVLKWDGSTWSAASDSVNDPSVQGFAKTNLPACGSGQVLKSNGSTLQCVMDATTGSAYDATKTTKGIVQIGNGLNVSSGVVSLGNHTHTINEVTGIPGCLSHQTMYYNSVMDSVMCQDITVDASAITSGTISGAVSINTTGTIDAASLSTTGNISAGGNLSTSGDLSAVGNLSTGGNLTVTGTLSAGGAISTTSDISATGKVTAGGDIQTTGGRMIASATSTTNAKVEVTGQILSKVFNAGSSTTIDWNNGNMQFTSASCGAFTFSNMYEGGTYTLVVTGATSGVCTFTQATPDTLNTTDFKYLPVNSATVASRTTVFTFVRAGGLVYVSWLTGF